MEFAENIWNNEKLIEVLKEGGIAVMPTDTIYGIVGSAMNVETVERIYKTRNRAPEKPCIILIGDLDDLSKFSITLSDIQKNKINEFWKQPKAVTIILDSLNEKFSYLDRGTKTLSFRLPVSARLKELLAKTGPLVAPSANTEGMTPSETIAEARNYFGNMVDFYLDAGTISGKPSRIVRLWSDGSVSIIRE